MTKRLPISVSQLCELVGVDPVQFRGIDAPKASVTAEGGLTYHGPLHLLVEEPDLFDAYAEHARPGHLIQQPTHAVQPFHYVAMVWKKPCSPETRT